MKALVLDNGLEILLITDNQANKSMCALNVATGSFDDFSHLPGIAHLLEHVLFKGTEKFPEHTVFHDFINIHQGFYNASTGYEHSDFCFEIDHDFFEKALEIFSSFFICPLFSKDVVDSEKVVINSEFQYICSTDQYRLQRIFNLTFNNEHPVCRFAYGNLSSLNEARSEDLFSYFNQNYSSNTMKLVLLSPYPAQIMEKWVNKFFSQIKNRNINGKKYSNKIFIKRKLPHFYVVKPDTTSKVLQISFEIPNQIKLYRTKPYWIINYILNHTSHGSLLEFLDKASLVSELWCSTSSFSSISVLTVKIILTETGVNRIEEIFCAFFSYIKLIKNCGYPEYLFNEQKKIAEIGYRFKESGEGLSKLRAYARNMHYYSIDTLDKSVELIEEYSLKDFNDILLSLTPDNMKVILLASGYDYNLKDNYSGIEYAKLDLDKKIINKLKNVNPYSFFKYPDVNYFVPDMLELIEPDDYDHPRKIIDDKRGCIWFMQNNKLRIPVAQINLLIVSKVVNCSPVYKLLSIIFIRLLQKSLENISSYAGDAGLSFGIDRENRGISLYVAGYSDKLIFLSEKIIDFLYKEQFTEDLLGIVCDKLSDDYESLIYMGAYEKAQYLKYDLLHYDNIDRDLYKDEIQTVTVAMINEFRNRFLSNIYIEGQVYGNLSSNSVTDYINYIFDITGADYLTSALSVTDSIISCETGKNTAYISKSGSEENCLVSYIEMGERSVELSAMVQLGSIFLKNMFFNEIRNKQQLAYIVECKLDFYEKVLGMSFSVLSDRADAFKLYQAMELFYVDFIEYLETVSDIKLNDAKKALINKINKTNRTLDDWIGELVLTAVLKGDLEYGNRLCDEVNKISISDMVIFFKNIFSIKSRKLFYIMVTNNTDKISEYNELNLVENILEYKNSRYHY